VFFKLFSDALFDCDFPSSRFDSVDDSGSEVLGIFSNAEVKKKGTIGRVFYKEGECGTGKVVESFYCGFDERGRGNTGNVGGCVNDSDFDGCAG